MKRKTPASWRAAVVGVRGKLCEFLSMRCTCLASFCVNARLKSACQRANRWSRGVCVSETRKPPLWRRKSTVRAKGSCGRGMLKLFVQSFAQSQTSIPMLAQTYSGLGGMGFSGGRTSDRSSSSNSTHQALTTATWEHQQRHILSELHRLRRSQYSEHTSQSIESGPNPA